MLWFDETLRQELMEAALEELEPTLESLTGWEQELSPRYRRERVRLLTDPWGWAKRRGRPAWKRIARNVACVLLACTVAFGALLAANPTVRAAVSTWLRQITQNGTSTAVTYTSGDPEKAAPALPWRVTWLPEGWTLDDCHISSFTRGGTWYFRMAGEDGATEDLELSYTPADNYKVVDITNDSVVLKDRTAIHGQPADHYEGEHSRMLAWEEADGALLRISSQFGVSASLERIAESVEPWTGVPAEYEVGWVPEGHRELDTQFSCGVGERTWVKDYTRLGFLYVNDPICPFRTPDRTPEEVTVNGLPGLFWPSEYSREEWDAQIMEEDYSPDSAVIPGDNIAAVLTWEDPETNTSFRILGIGEKEDFLRMAESVTRK